MKMGDKGVVKCHNCNGDHWKSKSPFKDTILAGEKVSDDKKPLVNTRISGAMAEHKPQGGKYVSLGMCDEGNKCDDSMQMQRRDETAIRIYNLSPSTTVADLNELVKPFGIVVKQYLSKEKKSNLCKGFAYVHFKHKADAARAIFTLNDYSYNDLILNVGWTKPQVQNN